MMKQHTQVFAFVVMLILTQGTGIAQVTFQLNNQTPAKITFLLPLTEAEMGKPLDFAQAQSHNVLKTPLIPGSTRSVPLQWADAGSRHLLAIAESAPGSFENTFTYFMLYNVSGSKITIEEQYRVGREQFGSMSETEPAQINIQNKTELPIYGLALRWEQADGMQEKALLKPWQVIPTGKESVIESEFNPWSLPVTFTLRAKLRKVDGTWLVKELLLKTNTVVIE